MTRWTFEREARWMISLLLVPPALGVMYALLIPWLRRATGQ